MNQPIYKAPPRSETHKVVSVRIADHQQMAELRRKFSHDFGRNVAMDEVIQILLEKYVINEALHK